ncbi:hypothetical protein EUGRSUZ_H01336 [Eucalyptus grandis]|uniref:Uncharacterized protein n=2 Tax=Eucalyptus grandis TaxID=71139 RepID=A0ACC3JNW2_EUCGR|nr:hypothetical protein EUGRSUZ_H01336 [Eucalyptus grandis]
MPLFELFKMAKAKLDSSLEKPTSSSTDLSSVPANELVELTWEHGQVVLQGQSSRAKRGPFSNNTPSNGSKPREGASDDDTRPRPGKFRNLECVLSEFPVTEQSSEIGLGQEDDMVPWLSFPVTGSLQNDYCSDLLTELTAVAANGTSPGNDDKSSSQIYRESHGIDNGVRSLGQTDASKFSSSAAGETTINRTGSNQLYSLPNQQFLSPLPCFRSRALDDVSTSTSSSVSLAVCGDKAGLPTSVVACSTVKVQRQQDLGHSDKSSCFTNFSCFSRPPSISRVNNAESSGQTAGFGLSGVDRSVSKEKASFNDNSTLSGSNFAVSSDGVQKQRKIDSSKPFDGKQYEHKFSVLRHIKLFQQMMSMGAGLYIPPMMVPTGMHPAQMPHFPPFGIGMGSAIGFGMGMVDMSGRSSGRPVVPVPPMQGPHFPSPLISAGMAGVNLQMFNFPGQGTPLPRPCAPLVPFPGGPVMKPAVGLGVYGMPTSTENSDSAVASRSKEAMQSIDQEPLQNTASICLKNQSSNQSAVGQSSCQTSDLNGSMAIESTGNDGSSKQIADPDL